LAGIQGLDRIIRVAPDPASPVLSPTSLICGDPQVQVTFPGEGG